MKTEVITEDWPNGQRMYEIPYVNGQEHGLIKCWYPNGQKSLETPYVNGKKHGISKWWNLDGSLLFLSKWHQGQLTLEINFPSEEQVQEDDWVALLSNS